MDSVSACRNPLINCVDQEISNDDDPDNNNNGNSLQTNDDNLLGFFAVIFLTVNATLGAGMLNIPFVFDEYGGIIFATLCQTFHVLLVILSLMILSYCAQISDTNSLQNLVTFFCGSRWGFLSTISTLLYSYGACITYIIIIGDQFDKIFFAFYGPDYVNHWYMSRSFLMFLIVCFNILPLCFSKDISFLKFASFIGFCSTLYIAFLVFFEYLKNERKDFSIKTRPDSWTEMFHISPVLLFSYQCQLSWVPTYAKIKNRTNTFRIFAMILVSMLICFLTYTWVAFFGILTFGSGNIEKDIMENYNPKDMLVSVGIVLLIIKTIVVYPVLLFCGRIVIEEFVFERLTNEIRLFGLDRATLNRVSIVTVWVISSCTLAVFVPNIAVAINYLGSLATLFVFILPGITLYHILLDQDLLSLCQNQTKLFNSKTLILVVSLFLVGYGVFTLVISLI